MSTRKPSETPGTDRDTSDEVGSFGGGFMGTGTLAFEPGFSLDAQYAGQPPAFDEGSKFGVYVVGPCIGEGGMARVYRAEHAGLKRQVALKVMTQGFARDVEGRERFLREARIAAAIKHPNVANIFDVGVCQGIPYLVMELLEGEDLEKVLISKGALDEGTIIDLVVPVVAGLVAVHDAGIVHRDLKPGNIFLARGRNDEIEPKLLDFGISKASGTDHLKLTAANGSLMGTPFYMAPEAVQGAEMTPLSDQYALGVVLRECATGKNPFEGNNFAEVVGHITHARYPSLAVVNPRLSKRFVAIVEKAMSLDPTNRFEDMRAMGRQLLMLAGQRTRITWGLTFGPEGRGSVALATLERNRMPEPSPEPPQPKRRSRVTWLLLAGVAVFSAGVTSLLVATPREPVEGSQATARLEPQPLDAVAAPKAASEPTPTEAAQAPEKDGGDRAAEPEEPALPLGAGAVAQSEKATDLAERPRAEPARNASRRSAPQKKGRTPSQRKRPAAPVAAAVDEVQEGAGEADWDIRVSAKPFDVPKPSFDVGSNNAPILD